MTPPNVPIKTGVLAVVLACPRCDELVPADVQLGARLVVDLEAPAPAALKPFLRSKPVPHVCGQGAAPAARPTVETAPMWDNETGGFE